MADDPKKPTLWNLKLHEGIATEFGVFIMRVPGGWIYDCWNFETDSFKKGTFIPFSNDLNPLTT